ncbi:MAG: hypothetical protein ACTSRJ_01755, partial [Candidatus Hodarchaeales archaeon]
NSSSADITNTSRFLVVFFLLPLTGISSNAVTSESDQCLIEFFFSSPHFEVNETGYYLRLYEREVGEYELFHFVGQN